MNTLSYKSAYFYAASISDDKSAELEESSNSTGDHNGSSSNMDKMKSWFLSHSQYLNFFTILLLASVSFDPLVCFLDLIFDLIVEISEAQP